MLESNVIMHLIYFRDEFAAMGATAKLQTVEWKQGWPRIQILKPACVDITVAEVHTIISNGVNMPFRVKD